MEEQTLEQSSWSNRRIAVILVLAVVIIGGLLVLSDWNEIMEVIQQASWTPLPFALFFMVLSYFCASYSFARVSKLFSIPISQRDLTEIGFVSIVLNHILTTAGLAGYSIRYVLMRRQGASIRNIVAASIFHFYLMSLVMLGTLPISVLYLVTHSTIGRNLTFALGLISLLLVIVFGLATGLVFSPSMRKPIMNLLSKLAAKVARRNVKPMLRQFDHTMVRGVDLMRSQPGMVLFIIVLIVIDWTTSAVTLWFCFDALGPTVSPGELMTGFVIGIMAGVISMVPGGLGVQEGSMTGVFTLLGISFEQSVLASILFRAMYFLLPYLISLGFYWRLLKSTEDEQVSIEKEIEHAHSDVEPWISSHH